MIVIDGIADIWTEFEEWDSDTVSDKGEESTKLNLMYLRDGVA